MKDTVDAGAGNDRVIIDNSDAALGGSGVDTLVLQSRPSDKGAAPLLKLDFALITAAKVQTFGLGATAAGQFENVDVSLDGLKAGSTLSGTAGDDKLMFGIVPPSDGGPLTGSGQGGSIFGRGGNDYISGSAFPTSWMVAPATTSSAISAAISSPSGRGAIRSIPRKAQAA
ncbi:MULTISPECIES: hypothetical protein [unclassified Rhizobium]|uniref:hypothetical protein n=1 Tax=unclassified Rhizobium TaxID=2613769 RepID=UPI0006F81D11|nr:MULTISPECIES: hypothetical protein [unclassified Rhizobium]KQV44057.1 hypothetical protein ASC86_04565 [Rhizobium sp. Root1212]KRD38238.1 hypothetical protein ASE37_04565 [Rhizobium sp. Root268]